MIISLGSVSFDASVFVVTQLPSFDSTRGLLCSGLFPEDRSQAASDSTQETDPSGVCECECECECECVSVSVSVSV